MNPDYEDIHEVLGRWRRGIIGTDELVEQVSKITKGVEHKLLLANGEIE